MDCPIYRLSAIPKILQSVKKVIKCDWERNNALDKDLKTFPAGNVITFEATYSYYVPNWEHLQNRKICFKKICETSVKTSGNYY